MPIYMDRHYEPESTRDQVAEAHAKDLAIESLYGVRFLTYWFDDERGTTFCLIDSPDKETVYRVHGEAHGSVPHEIIDVEPSLVEAFLGRVTDPRMKDGTERPDERAIDTAFRVIMFTDLKDSTAMTARLGDSQAMKLLRTHNALTRNAVRRHNAREVKHTGDGFMLSFAVPADAISCAAAIQQSFAEFTAANSATPLRVRIGLGAGEPVEEHGDLFGAAVQLASRVCSHAEADQILAGEVVIGACDGITTPINDRGMVAMKGFKEPVRVYELCWRD